MGLELDVVSHTGRDLTISGNDYSILAGHQEKNEDIYRLRAKVFFQELNWVPSTSREIDAYDQYAVHISVYSQQQLVGVLRILDSGLPWMLQNEFHRLAPSDLEKRKNSSSCEVTRLAVRKSERKTRFQNGSTISDLLYQGLFTYCMLNDLRRVYMVVSTAVLRALRFSGLPCREVSSPVSMPDGVVAVSACLDWSEFVEGNMNKKPGLVAGYMSALKQAQLYQHTDVGLVNVN